MVLDEGHAYRGAFGCHTALVLRRLRRLCARAHGSEPLFIVTSATVRVVLIIGWPYTELYSAKLACLPSAVTCKQVYKTLCHVPPPPPPGLQPAPPRAPAAGR